MRILAVIQGVWGQRFVDKIRERGPKDWTVETFQPPMALPIILDEPEEFLPETLPQVDMVLGCTASATAAQLIPAIARLCGAKAVLCPIDDTNWMPEGLKNQIQGDLEKMGIESVFPKPFCTLTEETAGYRGSAQPYNSETVSEFARYFGRPKLNLTVNEETGIIVKVEVVRGSPCGATEYAAERLEGISVEDAVPQAGLISHQFPCLASMERIFIDDRLTSDTLMHVSGYVMNEEMEEKVRPYKKSPQYFTPGERAENSGETKE